MRDASSWPAGIYRETPEKSPTFSRSKPLLARVAATGHSTPVHGLAGFVTALALVSQPATDVCPRELPGLGVASAPVVVTFFLDPLTGSNLMTWLELRGQIAAMRGQARAEVAIVQSSSVIANGREPVTLWLMRAQRLGRLEAGLRLLDREGQERLLVRLRTKSSRKTLARELGIADDGFENLLTDTCLLARLQENTTRYMRDARRSNGALPRPPVFTIGDQSAFEKLSFLPGAVEKERSLRRDPMVVDPPARRRRRGVSPRVRRPPANAGLMIGDVGSEHRLVVFLRPDPRPRLTQLSPVLEYHRNHPGKLAIQLLVRGSSPDSQDLRRRMCHATDLGLEVEYVYMLAAGRTQWSTKARDADDLEKLIDTHEPAKPCSLDEVQLEGEGNLPDGVWLDGGIIGQTTDLEHIATRIAEIERATSPSDAVFSLLPQPEI